MFRYGFFIYFILCSSLTMAQFPLDPYAEVYPERPFSLEQTLEAGFHKITIWYDENQKSAGDISGVPWSNNLITYQQQRYILPEDRIELFTHYDSKGDKLRQMKYYYLNGQVSAIDEFEFDSLQEPELLYSYNYAYKGDVPLQMVKLHNHDKHFRLMHAFLFNKDKKMIRKKVTSHGQAKRMETVSGLEANDMMLLTAYSKNSKTVRSYQQMHDLVRTERTQYDDDGKALNTKILDGNQQLIYSISYQYQGDKLAKKTYMAYNGTQMVEEKVIYYAYNYQTGLIEQKIVERGDLQMVYSYQYSEDF